MQPFIEQYREEFERAKERQRKGYSVAPKLCHGENTLESIDKAGQYLFFMDKRRPVSLERCRYVCEKIKGRTGLVFEQLTVFMTEYDYDIYGLDRYVAVVFGDGSLPVIGKRKEARYFHSKNTLLILEEGTPVYENANGVVCRDQAALVAKATDC